MSAAHVVTENLEAGPRVDFGPIGEQQVAVLLIGVCALRARTHNNAPVEDAVTSLVRHPLKSLARAGVAGHVLDQDGLVVVLVSPGEVKPVENHLGAVAGEADSYLVARDRRPKRHRTGLKLAVLGLMNVKQ
jgi:hypothetical protein